LTTSRVLSGISEVFTWDDIHFSRKSGVTFAHTSQVYRLEVWTSK
jgi:hypothetical protein